MTTIADQFDRTDMLRKALIDVFGDRKDGSIDAMIDVSQWHHIEGGEILFRRGDPSDNMYFIVSGRLRFTSLNLENNQVISELVRGDTIGEMAILSQSLRKGTAECMRDSSLVSISTEDMIRLSNQYPHLLLRISKIAIDRLTSFIDKGFEESSKESKVTNIMIYPINRGADISTFVAQLITALQAYGDVFTLCSTTVINAFGDNFADDANKETALIAWLEEKEQSNRFVLYLADCINEDWHHRAVRQSDRILLVADSEDDPIPSQRERELFNNTKGKTHLVLTHPVRNCANMQTKQFLEPRELSKHYHIVKDLKEDVSRVARYMNGSANGLVFAGGGARGFAHLGVIKAFIENDLPIDMLGGTSMGAIMASAYSVRMDIDPLIDEVRDIFVRQKPLNDYTLPFISVFAGKKLDRLLHNFYGDAQIEDCWSNFFCVAANLSQAGTTVMSKGTIWKAVRSSLSLPGVVPPVNIDGDLHIDGGIVNNYPVDVMREFGAGTVIGVDLVEGEDVVRHSEDLPDAWTLLKNKVMRRATPHFHGTTIGSIIVKSALLSSARATKKNALLADFHWGVNASQFGLLKFADFDKILEVGYKHACTEIANMSEEDLHKLRF